MDIYKYCMIVAIIFLGTTLYYIKRRRIEFNYCILWFSISLTILILSIDRNILTQISNVLGIYYSPSFLFLGGIILNMALTFYITIKISDIKKKLIRNTQEIGMLKGKLNNEKEK